MAKVAITMPKLGLTMKEGEIESWIKEVGDAVTKGEPIVEISTEKITNSIECPADGVIAEIIAEEGEEYEVGAVLGYIETEA